MPAKCTLEQIKQYLENTEYKLLSNAYTNNYTKLDIECDKGHVYKMCWGNVSRGYKCPICKINKITFTLQTAIDKIKSAEPFYSVLSTEYINARTPLTIKCNKQHIYKCSLDNFNKGKRCPTCWKEYNKGENSSNWKPTLTEAQRLDNISRGTKDVKLKEWRKAVLNRDNYTCQKCALKLDKGLEVHHILGWAEYPNLRYEVTNGIAFCTTCHIQFHKEHGKNDFNRFDLDWFLDKDNFRAQHIAKIRSTKKVVSN